MREARLPAGIRNAAGSGTDQPELTIRLFEQHYTAERGMLPPEKSVLTFLDLQDEKPKTVWVHSVIAFFFIFLW